MIDRFDLQIMNLLGRDGRISNVDLANKLGVPNSTVRQRLKRMTEKGIISFSCEVASQKFHEIIIVFSGIIINANRDKILNELDKISNILFSVGVTGRYDFIAVFVDKSTEMINDTLSKINKINGVVHTESFIVVKNNGFHIQSDKFSQLIQASIPHDKEEIDITD